MHSYLGMTFDFSVPYLCRVTMSHFIEKMLADVLNLSTTVSPATDALHHVREIEKLSPEDMDIFHSLVAKLLYLSKRVRMTC